jgi:hypothetical protein
MAVLSPNDSINRILEALGLEKVKSLTIACEVNSPVMVTTEQYVAGSQLDGLAAVLETKEWVLVPKQQHGNG